MGSVLNDIGNIASWIGGSLGLPGRVREVERIIIKEVAMNIPARGFIRLAGLSGATAVAMGAYGAHAFKQQESSENLKLTFESGNKMHMIHSVALLAIPLTRRPYLVGTLMTAGMFIFCGSCYYHALSGSTQIRWVTPYGGMMLIFAWIAMMF